MDHQRIMTATQLREHEQRQLAAAKEAFPNWEFYRIFGGWIAVPKGAMVIQGMDIDSVVEKLRTQE